MLIGLRNQLTVFANEDVFGLQVPINDLLGVQVTESKSDLHSEELGLVLWELPDLDQVAEELTTLDKLHQEVNTELILEDVFHIN